MSFDHPIVELRQYTLFPGQRDVLIELFDREFVTGQEAAGIAVIGQFRDLDRPDRFVWFRGFADIETRLSVLTSFYTGPDWRQHRTAANATMIDSDNVLLLHPAGTHSISAPNVAVEATSDGPGLLVVTIVSLPEVASRGFATAFERTVRPALVETGASVIATFETDASPNSFPALPVREGEHVFVWLTAFRDAPDHAAHLSRRAASERWQGEVEPLLMTSSTGAIETLRLEATSGSRYRPVMSR